MSNSIQKAPINKGMVILNMVILITVAIFASDAYLPSLPAIADSFHAGSRAAKLTISLYLLGLGIAPLWYGPLSEKYGRRKILLFGISIALVGSLICTLSESITWIIIGRFIQGFGIASGMSLSRTIGSDLFRGKQLAKVGSIIGMIIGVVPAMAPIAGGYMQHAFGWRSNFILIFCLIIFAGLWVLLSLPETNAKLQKNAMQLKGILSNYASLFKTPAFIIHPLLCGVAFAGCMTYLTISPFLFQNILGLSPIQYGWLAFAVGGGIIVGSFANSLLVKRVASGNLLIFSAWLMLAIGLFMLTSGYLGYLNVTVVMIPIFFFMIAIQFVFANSFSIGMAYASKKGGLAAAVFSSVQIGSAALASAIASMVTVHNQIFLAYALLTLGCIAIGLVFWQRHSLYPDES
jgi:DHA1 family 2-module integral membrane pump EmrD-like MFS transporter